MAYKRRHKDKRTFFIAEATANNEGSLREYVLRVLGEGAFKDEDVEHGAIDRVVLRRIASGKCLTHGSTHVCPNETTQRRARLAEILNKIRDRRNK